MEEMVAALARSSSLASTPPAATACISAITWAAGAATAGATSLPVGTAPAFTALPIATDALAAGVTVAWHSTTDVPSALATAHTATVAARRSARFPASSYILLQCLHWRTRLRVRRRLRRWRVGISL